MYSRIRDGLLSPSSIVDYIKDKWYKPFFQIILYALLLTIPTVISILTYEGLNYDQKMEIRKAFDGEEIPFSIVDGKLVSTKGDDFVYENELLEIYKVVISTNENSGKEISENYTIVFREEAILLSFAGVEMKIANYNDIDKLKNFELSLLGDYNNTNEWNDVFAVCNDVVKSYINFAALSISFSAFIQNVMVILIIALIISMSFVFRFSKLLKFSAMYKMSIYYTAPFVIGCLLSSLFNLGILYYIGMIVSLVYSIIGSNVIVQRLMNQGRK